MKVFTRTSPHGRPIGSIDCSKDRLHAYCDIIKVKCEVCDMSMQKSALTRHKKQKHADAKTYYACDHPCKRVFGRSDKYSVP